MQITSRKSDMSPLCLCLCVRFPVFLASRPVNLDSEEEGVSKKYLEVT